MGAYYAKNRPITSLRQNINNVHFRYYAKYISPLRYYAKYISPIRYYAKYINPIRYYAKYISPLRYYAKYISPLRYYAKYISPDTLLGQKKGPITHYANSVHNAMTLPKIGHTSLRRKQRTITSLRPGIIGPHLVVILCGTSCTAYNADSTKFSVVWYIPYSHTRPRNKTLEFSNI